MSSGAKYSLVAIGGDRLFLQFGKVIFIDQYKRTTGSDKRFPLGFVLASKMEDQPMNIIGRRVREIRNESRIKRVVGVDMDGLDPRIESEISKISSRLA
jgi:hypothetical protein